MYILSKFNILELTKKVLPPISAKLHMDCSYPNHMNKCDWKRIKIQYISKQEQYVCPSDCTILVTSYTVCLAQFE